MNDLCYEHSKDGVCLNSFDCVFVHIEVRCTNITEIQDGLQYTNKKLSLSGDINIYTLEDLEMNQKYNTFSKPFYLLDALSLWSSTDDFYLKTDVSKF